MAQVQMDYNSNETVGNTCRRINLSFKDNPRDNNLFNTVKSKNDKSAFVKDCIEFYINNHNKTLVQDNNVNNNSDSDANINNKSKKKRKIQFKAD